MYTLIVNSDNTYEVLIDNQSAQKGKLEEDWDFLPAKEIKDPNEKKPSDWDEREKIPDPDAVKPEVSCFFPYVWSTYTTKSASLCVMIVDAPD